MKKMMDLLEIPLDKIKNVDDLVKWFEQQKLHQKDSASIVIPDTNSYAPIALFGFVLLVGMALLILEEKGKLKVKSPASKKNPEAFMELLKSSKTQSHLHRLIESRYDLHLVLASSQEEEPLLLAAEPAVPYGGLDAVFGIWKDKKITLNKVRNKQWERKK